MQIAVELTPSSLSKTDPESPLDAPPRPSQRVHFTGVRRTWSSLLKAHNDLKLRTKLLWWLVLFTAALTSATLLVMPQSAQAQVQRQKEQDRRNAGLTRHAVSQ